MTKASIPRLRSERGSLKKFFESHVLTCTQQECLIWPFPSRSHGYGRIWWEGKMCDVSRLACEAVHGRAPSSEYEIAHSCGNGQLGCVNPQHVRWATSKENKADQLIHNTRNRGSRHGKAKLTEDDVRKIRSLALTMSQTRIAEQFGVAVQAINDIVRRKNWGWLK
jgi:hypothetical protein